MAGSSGHFIVMKILLWRTEIPEIIWRGREAVPATPVLQLNETWQVAAPLLPSRSVGQQTAPGHQPIHGSHTKHGYPARSLPPRPQPSTTKAWRQQLTAYAHTRVVRIKAKHNRFTHISLHFLRGTVPTDSGTCHGEEHKTG